MSAPSENMPIAIAAPRAKPLLLRHPDVVSAYLGTE